MNSLTFINGLGKKASIHPSIFKWILKTIHPPHLGTRIRLKFLSKALKQFNLPNEVKILDACCGFGFSTLYLAKKYKNVIGLDIDKDRLKIARKLAKLLNIQTQYFQADIYKLPFKSNFFDLCICMEVFEHLEKDKTALKELSRVTKKGGFLIVSFPNLRVNLSGFEILGHVRGGYTVSQFKKRTQEMGYKIVSHQSVGVNFLGKAVLNFDLKMAKISPILSSVFSPITEQILSFEQFIPSKSIPYLLFAVFVKKD